LRFKYFTCISSRALYMWQIW